jgi:hypothetical protein
MHIKLLVSKLQKNLLNDILNLKFHYTNGKDKRDRF